VKPAKGPKKPPAGSLQIVAGDAAVVTGTTTTFGATGGDSPYKFAFADAGNVSGGSIDRQGHYRAGPATGTDTIEVTDHDRNTASTTVEVKPALQVEVPDDEMHKVKLGTPEDEPEWWETWESWGGQPANPSSALEITVASGVEVTLKALGGVPDYRVQADADSGGVADAPAAGKGAFTYTAGTTVGSNRRATDTLTITDGQSTSNRATVTVTVTEDFEDLAALASSGGFKMPFVAYRTWHPFAGFSFHDGLIFPPPPAVSVNKLPCIDFSLLHTTGLQSLPSRGHGSERGPVLAPGGAYLIGRGSDAGFVVPHVSIPINNLLLPLVIILGESKSLFGSSSVRLPCWSVLGGTDECDTACVFPVPWLPLVGLNLACSDDFPLPTDFVFAPSTILVGMSWLDLLGGVIDLALEYAVAGLMVGFGKGAGQISETMSKRAAAKAAKKAAKEAAEKAAKEVAEAAVEKGAKEVAEKAAKEAVEEAAERAAKEGAEEVAEKAAKEAAEEGAGKAAKEGAGEAGEKAGKKGGFGKKLWADQAEKKRLFMASADAKKLVKQGLSPEEAYEKVAKRGGWGKARDVLEGLGEAIFIEQPLGWAAGRLGKIDDTLRGLEEYNRDWWEWGEIIPMVESPIVQTIWPQPPAGEGWWGD
jgi:hypothetical protein